MADSKMVNLDEITDNFLLCGVCLEPYKTHTRVALLLPCRHSYCAQCIQKISDGHDFLCPSCRHKVTLEEPSISLPIDIVTMKVVDFVQMKTSAAELFCKNCPDDNKATHRCQRCEHFMCEECHLAHKRVLATREHATQSISDLLQSPSQFFQQVDFCPNHAEMKLNLFCEKSTCQLALCTICAMLSHREEGHTMKDLSAVYEKERDVNSDFCDRLDAKLTEIESDIDKYEQGRMDVEMKHQAALTNVNTTCDQIIKAVNCHRERFVQTLNDVRDGQTTQLVDHINALSKKRTEVKETMDYLKKAISVTQPAEFVRVQRAMKTVIEKLLTWSLKEQFVGGVSYCSTGLSNVLIAIRRCGAIVEETQRQGRILSFATGQGNEAIKMSSINLIGFSLPSVTNLSYCSLSPMKVLSNKPAFSLPLRTEKSRLNPSRLFPNYRGTHGIINFHDGRHYWQCHLRSNGRKKIEPNKLVCELAVVCRTSNSVPVHFVSETPGGWGMTVRRCRDHPGKLCAKGTGSNQSGNCHVLASYTDTYQLTRDFGMLLDIDQGTFTVYDLTDKKKVCTLAGVTPPVYPMFGAYNYNFIDVELTLQTGGSIRMEQSVFDIFEEESHNFVQTALN